MSEFTAQPEPACAPDQGIKFESEGGGMAASVRRSRSRPAHQGPEDASEVDDLAITPAKRAKRLQEEPSQPKEETKAAPNEGADATVAAATLAMPMREAAERDKLKTAASKAALLNPPRQQPSRDETTEQTTDPVERATHYNAAMIRLQGTLSNLEDRIKRYDGHISADDLEQVHDQFETFMNFHPIHSPMARQTRAAMAAAATAGAPSVPQTAPRKVGRPRKKNPLTSPAPSSAATYATYGGNTSYMHSPGVPIFYSVPVTVDDLIEPPAAPQAYLPDGNANPYYYTYEPEQEQYHQELQLPGPEDRAAIAQATAAVRQAANHDESGSLDSQTAMQLLQILSSLAPGTGNLGNEWQRQPEPQPNTDE